MNRHGLWFADGFSVGIMCLHHTDRRFDPQARMWSLMAALRTTDSRNLQDIEDNTYGPVFPLANLYHSVNQAKYPRLWIPHPPVQQEEKISGYRVLAKWDDPNKALQSFPAESYKDVEYPNAWPFTILNGVDIDKRIKLVFPGFPGLACAHTDANASKSSLVWRIDPTGTLDPNVRALIHSFWYVWNDTPPNLTLPKGQFPKKGGLAWRLNNGPEDARGLGMIIDTVGKEQKLASTAHKEGGMLSTGEKDDQHSRGKTADGLEISAAHTNSNQIFIRDGGSGDGPMRDQGEWIPCGVGPFLVECHWRFDSEAIHTWVGGRGVGLWKDQSTAFFAYIKPDPVEPEDPIPIPTPEPEFTTGPFFDPDYGSVDDGVKTVNDYPIPPSLNTDHSRDVKAEPTKGYDTKVTQVDPPSSMAEMGFSSLLRRASGDFDDPAEYDKRYAKGPFDRRYAKKLHDEWSSLPAVVREDVVADFDNIDDSADQRNVSNNAPGAVVQMPANLGVEDAFESRDLPAFKTVYKVGYNLRYGHGTPNSKGKIIDGFTFINNGEAYEFFHHPIRDDGSDFKAFEMVGDAANHGGGFSGVNEFTEVYSDGGVTAATVVYGVDQVGKDDVNKQLMAPDVSTVNGTSITPIGFSPSVISAGEYGRVIRRGLYKSSLNASSGSANDPVYFTSAGALSLSNTGSRVIGRVLFAENNAWVYLSFPGESPAGGNLGDAIFGDKSDGDLTVSSSSTHTLTSDEFYDTVTLEDNATIELTKFALFCHTLISDDGTAVIHADGEDGSGSAGGGSTEGITATNDGTYNKVGAGGDVTGSGSNPGASGQNDLGGDGGDGGDHGGGASGASGATATNASLEDPKHLWHAQTLRPRYAATGVTSDADEAYSGGGGGGSGGGTVLQQGSGGGGEGGGIACVFAKDMSSWSGTIRANGGDGADGVASNGGGGGGGGGGAVIVVSNTAVGSRGTLEAVGGSGGSGTGTGSAGSDGADGNTYSL